MKDRVSVAARKAETGIDHVFLENPLVRQPFAAAASYVLAVADEQLLALEIKGALNGYHAYEAFSDNLKFVLKNALLWLSGACPPDGDPPRGFDRSIADHATALLDLASRHNPFVLAFTYGSLSVVAVDVQDHEVLITDELKRSFQFEAYDRMSHQLLERKSLEWKGEDSELPALIETIDARIVGRKHGYDINLNPRVVGLAVRYLRRVLGSAFTLPLDWQFPRYTLGQFLEAFLALAAIATVHHLGRVRLARGLGDLPPMLPIRLMPRDELFHRVARYSGIDEQRTNEIIRDLTYGERQQMKPDPALQPLVPLNQELVALTPVLFMTSNAERNFIALMNRIPEEKGIYARLTESKEQMMRDAILEQLRDKGWRAWHGRVPGPHTLPDVDLAFIDDEEKACIVTEMKWLLEPAEPGEIVHRFDEIKRGVQQTLQLRNAFDRGYAPLVQALKIDSSYRTCFGLVSANTIGSAEEQDPNVFIIHQDHFAMKLQSVESLARAAEWLSSKLYLPVEGRDFEVVYDVYRCGAWTLKWHRIRLITPEPPMR